MDAETLRLLAPSAFRESSAAKSIRMTSTPTGAWAAAEHPLPVSSGPKGLTSTAG